MIYVKKISDNNYKNTIAAMADHVLITREEEEYNNRQHIEKTRKIEELSLSLDMVLEENSDLGQQIASMQDEKDMIMDFVRERNAQYNDLKHMYESALMEIDSLHAENNFLRRELNNKLDSGFAFV